jgi:Xaa-Pro aminopeptidase
VISRGLSDAAITTGAWVKRYHLYGNFFFSGDSVSDNDPEGKHFMDVVADSPAYPNAVEALTGCLVQRGLAAARIGIDQGTDAVGLGNLIKEKLPGLSVAPAYDLFRKIRLCKTEGEITRIRHSIAATEAGIMDGIAAIREGATELDVRQAFSLGVVRHGGLPALDCVGSGPRGAFPNVAATDRVIRFGDVVRFDVGCIADWYHSDMARTAVLGQPAPKVQNYHDAIVAGEKAILDAMKPGVPLAELFRIGVETVRANGIPHYERNHCGHGNGIEGYDLPPISAAEQSVLEPGMVLCVETPYYEPGFAGIQIEDIVVVREHGIERLTTLEQKLFIV